MLTLRNLLFGILIIGCTKFFDLGNASKMMPLFINIHTAESESWKLGLVDNSVAIIPRPGTFDNLSGGIFGFSKIFFINLIQFSWNVSGKKIKLKAIITFHNAEYGSLNNALNYSDGVVQLQVPIYSNGDRDNPAFDNFEIKIKEIIESGSQNSTFILSGASFSWYKKFPLSATFTYYPNSYYDLETGKLYNCSTTYVFPLEKKGNYISLKQFEGTFGSFNKGSGKQVNNMPPEGEPLSTAKKGKQIIFMPILGNLI